MGKNLVYQRTFVVLIESGTKWECWVYGTNSRPDFGSIVGGISTIDIFMTNPLTYFPRMRAYAGAEKKESASP